MCSVSDDMTIWKWKDDGEPVSHLVNNQPPIYSIFEVSLSKLTLL